MEFHCTAHSMAIVVIVYHIHVAFSYLADLRAVAVGMMEPTDGSPPNSMYMVRCGEMFPKPVMEKEDEKLGVPFKERKCTTQ